MDISVTAQKKRPENSAGSAWLRGGQTLAHTYDMIMELWNKLRWMLLLWAALCIGIANNAAPDEDQIYAGLHIVAWIYRTFGSPFPQTLSVPDMDGVRHVVTATAYDAVPFIKVSVDRYFSYMWKGAWLWLFGSVCMVAWLSYAFIRSGIRKLESHDIRGQQIVPLHVLVALIRRYNIAKAREVNQDTLTALGMPQASHNPTGSTLPT